MSSGKWYFEFEILTAGPMRVGWAKADCAPGSMLGSDENTWAFDGYNVSFQRHYIFLSSTQNLMVNFKSIS